MAIHPTAIIGSKAIIHENCEIGPYSLIEDDVQIGPETVIGSHTTIQSGTKIGSNCFIASYVSLGFPPQDLSYKGEKTELIIGNQVTVREFATIHRGTVKGGGKTIIKDNCYFMNYVHIGHDCQIDESVVIANTTQLAGHVHVHTKATISSMFLAHQFISIGEHSMLAAMSAVLKSVPPYIMTEGRPARIIRVNTIGLTREGFSTDEISAITAAYNLIRKKETRLALEEIEIEAKRFPRLMKIVEFYRTTNRGVISFLRLGHGESQPTSE
jgi:UDP-N-acetylglucosamine acyltransferase